MREVALRIGAFLPPTQWHWMQMTRASHSKRTICADADALALGKSVHGFEFKFYHLPSSTVDTTYTHTAYTLVPSFPQLLWRPCDGNASSYNAQIQTSFVYTVWCTLRFPAKQNLGTSVVLALRAQSVSNWYIAQRTWSRQGNEQWEKFNIVKLENVCWNMIHVPLHRCT